MLAISWPTTGALPRLHVESRSVIGRMIPTEVPPARLRVCSALTENVVTLEVALYSQTRACRAACQAEVIYLLPLRIKDLERRRATREGLEEGAASASTKAAATAIVTSQVYDRT